MQIVLKNNWPVIDQSELKPQETMNQGIIKTGLYTDFVENYN
jgi:hypothetical protein